MSKFDLRDVSKRLSESRDTEAVVDEFLRYLQGLKPDWHASLAFYEVSRDALVHLYTRERDRLVGRDIMVPVEQLPTRLVRKFFHPSAFSNAPSRRSLLSSLFKSSPFYEPEGAEAVALRPVAPISDWISCLCMPLADQEDLLAILVIASRQKGAFGNRVVDDLVAVKGMAALALAQHLYRSGRALPEAAMAGGGGDVPGGGEPPGEAAAADFHEQIQRIDRQGGGGGGDASDARFEALAREAAPDVRRVRCIADSEGDDPAGVRVLIVPSVTSPDGRMRLDDLLPSDEACATIQSHLDERRLVGTRVRVEPAQYTGVRVRARVSAEGHAEPLCAAYHRRCQPAIRAALDRGVRKVTDGLAGLRIDRIAHAEWKKFDSHGRLFKNMNTPADYDAAREILGGQEAEKSGGQDKPA